MTVGSDIGTDETSTEEQDHLDRSKKKVKATETSSEELLEKNDEFNETERERSVDCEAAYPSFDEEMKNKKETKANLEEKGTSSNPMAKLPASLLKKIRKVWNLQVGFETLDIGNGFFIVKFEMMEDYTKVFTGGPWVVMDRYVIVRKWQPDFKFDETEKDTMAIWVLGTPLKVDISTAMAARGKYARVCVEIDLHKPLISRITIGRYHYVVEYEHLHTLCFSCGRVGHRKEKCTEFPVIQPKKMIQNVIVTQPESNNGPGTSQPTGQKKEERYNLEEKQGYGP
ncbi:uncharacterized protein LOC114264702 [Camellia sinensis]|uniref:uncharacterized protein LOC114264702 n=1 Tax=Camellia sinensis TaxID=4442 RepID=UPI001036BD92|nr:uncharacterized protein LOC114264702 [Camellia sinensis]